VRHLVVPPVAKAGSVTTARELLDGEYVIVTVAFGRHATPLVRAGVAKLLASVHTT
jgi:hypothetical protein